MSKRVVITGLGLLTGNGKGRQEFWQAIGDGKVGYGPVTLFDPSEFTVNQAAEVIKQAVSPEANIIFGVANNATMENEITITLIATGFHAKLGMGKDNKEDEQLTNMLKNMKTEEELDMPSFLRRPLFSHRRTMPQPNSYPAEPVKQRHFQ